MGFLSTAVQAIGGLAGNIFNANSQDSVNNRMIAMNRENNQFNSNEAEKNRQFQQKMANTEMSRRVADMRSAGLNPAFSDITGATTPSGSSASSGSSPSLSAPKVDPLTLSQIHLNEASADKLKAEEGQVTKATDWMDKLNESTIAINESNISVNASNISLNDKQKEQLNELIKKAQAETNYITEQTEKVKAEIGNISMDTLLKGIELYYKSDLFEAEIKKLQNDAGLSYEQARDLCTTRVARIRNLNAQSDNYEASTTKLTLEGGILSVDYETGKINLEIKESNKDFDKTMYKVNGVIDAVGNSVGIVTDCVNIKNLLKGSKQRDRSLDLQEERNRNDVVYRAAQHEETKRHNQVEERNHSLHLGNESISEQRKYDEHIERKRHNQATENIMLHRYGR